MLALLRSNITNSTFTPTADFFKDINCFLTFLAQYNGVTFYDNSKATYVVHLDASLTGLGGSFADRFADQFMNYSIVHLEILNIMVALKIWANAGKINKNNSFVTTLKLFKY